jgi:type IV pilus assembly protein PilX
MTTGRHPPYPCRQVQRHSQSGVVMVMTLICLVLMLIASVALTRSSTNSLLQAGNFAFKRDLLNQAERGFAKAINELNSGTELKLEHYRENDLSTKNYSAKKLASNAQGIPNVLINDSTFSASDIMKQSDITDSASGITIRTVIDRQCSGSGAFSTANCVPYEELFNAAQAGTARLKRVKGENTATYRISVRVKGPRNTEAFQQMIVTL